jgi:hypothetical protein
MQRMLVTVSVIVLVLGALAIGALAAHWPFWQRAWQWHAAAGGWPADLPGLTVELRPSQTPMTLQLARDARLAPRAGHESTQLLLVGDVQGQGAYWSAPGFDAATVIDGRGLATALLAPLFGALQSQAQMPLLDVPLRDTLSRWRDDMRGEITPRQLLWQLSGLAAEPFVPLNPASRRAQLASGPDFNRAALHTRLDYPPGSHFEPTPANAQLLAVVAGTIDGAGYAVALDRNLWQRFASGAATGLLDHRRGNMAAHCCIRAAAGDWLRLGLLLADGGKVAGARILPEGYVSGMMQSSPVHPGYGLGYAVAQLPDGSPVLTLESTGRRLAVAPAAGRALLWMGQGDPPEWLDELLLPAGMAWADNAPSE